jgi:prepilin-type N-terminal cleavage/methylation domain-containing protein
MRADYKMNGFRQKGLTLIEMVVSMAIIVIVFSALLPQFRVMFRSWDLRQASAETLQNSRVFTDHLERLLAQAVTITAVSLSTDNNGYIEFEGSDGNNYRYDYSNNYIRFGLTGQQQIMAGPVSSLRFTCYALSNLNASITTPTSSIDYVQVDTVFTDSTGRNQNETVTAPVMLARTPVVSTQGLVARYKLDATSGLTASDSSGNNLTGTLLNMSGDATEWVPAIFNNGLYMNASGTTDVVYALDNNLLDLGNQGTLAAWIYMTTGTAANEGIIHKGNLSGNSDEAYYLYASRISANTYRLGIILRNASTNRTLNSTTPTLGLNTWRHVAGVWNATNVYLYVDGSLVASVASVVVPRNSTGQLNIGAKFSSGTQCFRGKLDEVRIYNRALSAAEILDLATGL